MQGLRGLRNQEADSSPSITVGTSTQVKIGGKRYTSVNAIPHEHREALLNIHDPIRALNLTDDSVFYRATENKWVKNGRISGNPKSYANITNYHAVRENPSHAVMESSGYHGWTLPYEPVDMRAHELGQPILNVMFDPNAEQQARGYAERPGRTMIAMTLGDFRRAGGGDVYFDAGAAMNDGVNHALVVTLPKKASVPVTIDD
ncbi:AvrPphF family type III effector [Ralstonia syzygii]|uniref:AvrPphF family type III effector n=1 Tax=Ralstonia syzygii TaxID=28097 RepID=UPI0018D11E8E|nr:AvrPphF family type III effector [Ralstonia syzygii]